MRRILLLFFVDGGIDCLLLGAMDRWKLEKIHNLFGSVQLEVYSCDLETGTYRINANARLFYYQLLFFDFFSSVDFLVP